VCVCVCEMERNWKHSMQLKESWPFLSSTQVTLAQGNSSKCNNKQ
jgi:hypothetical protein